MRTPSETFVANNFAVHQKSNIISIYVNGGNTVGGRWLKTPTLYASNTNPTKLNANTYVTTTSGFSKNKVSFAVLPIQIWNDSNETTRRKWLYLKGPYSDKDSLLFTNTNKFLYPTRFTYDSDPESKSFYSDTANYSSTNRYSKAGALNDVSSLEYTNMYNAPSQEIFINVVNGTNSPVDVRTPVTYISPFIEADSNVSGSLEINVINSSLLLSGAMSFTPSPNNYTRQVDFTSDSTITDATVMQRKQQVWIVG